MNPHSNLSINWLLRSSCVALLSLWLASSCVAQNYYKSTARPKAEIDTLLPFDIELLASRGINDTAFTSSDFVLQKHLGQRPIVMLFWLTTCGPCRSELAALSEQLPEWKEQYDFAFIPVSIDFPKRRAEFHERASNYNWTSYLDLNREFPLVLPGRLNGVPQIFVYNTKGEQIFHRRKYRAGDLETLEQILKRGKG